MKISELRNLSKDELKNNLLNFKKELFNLRFQKVAGTITNTARFKIARKMVAKILTLLNNDCSKNG